MAVNKKQLGIWFMIGLSVAAGCTSVAAEILQSSHPGAKLVLSKCGGCHKVYAPSDYSKERWEEELPDMKHRAKLTDSEYEQISEFIMSAHSSIK